MSHDGKALVGWVLDRAEAYPERAGQHTIRTDMELLDAVARGVSTEPVVVRGERLGRWAHNIARARGWQVLDLDPPSDVLKRLLPQGTGREIQALVARLADRIWDLSEIRAPQELLALLGLDQFWRRPDSRHAAEWILWWAGSPGDSALEVVMAHVGRMLSSESLHPFLTRAFQCSSTDHAFTLLHEWLGILSAESAEVPAWPDVDLPAGIRNELLQRFEGLLVTNPDCLTDDILLQVHERLRTPVAELVAHHLIRRSALSVPWFRRLEPMVPPDTLAEMRQYVAWPDPGAIPENAADVVRWFQTRYLPWRAQLTETEEQAKAERRDELNLAFADWYLRRLPEMLVNPTEQPYLAWVRTNQLRRGSREAGFVTLLVIFDGLLPGDSQLLAQRIRENARLDVTQVATEWAYTMIPTVTEFTKQVIVRGDIEDDGSPEELRAFSRVEDVRAQLENAKPGDVVRWVLDQPDKTYHFGHLQTSRESQVEAQLNSIVSELAKLRRVVNPAVGFHLILTSDHGRYLGKPKVVLEHPLDMEAHGRAAWGTKGSTPRDVNYVIEEDVAWLNPKAYGLPAGNAYAIALGDASFRSSDGRSPCVPYPHGGLSPEEVLVPWLVFESNVIIDEPQIAVAGSGQARQGGEVWITVRNPSRAALQLTELTVSSIGASEEMSVRLDGHVGALDEVSLRQSIQSWPDLPDEAQIQAKVWYLLPSGEERFVDVTATLRTKAMYRSSLSLEDLT